MLPFIGVCELEVAYKFSLFETYNNDRIYI